MCAAVQESSTDIDPEVNPNFEKRSLFTSMLHYPNANEGMKVLIQTAVHVDITVAAFASQSLVSDSFMTPFFANTTNGSIVPIA